MAPLHACTFLRVVKARVEEEGEEEEGEEVEVEAIPRMWLN